MGSRANKVVTTMVIRPLARLLIRHAARGFPLVLSSPLICVYDTKNNLYSAITIQRRSVTVISKMPDRRNVTQRPQNSYRQNEVWLLATPAIRSHWLDPIRLCLERSLNVWVAIVDVWRVMTAAVMAISLRHIWLTWPRILTYVQSDMNLYYQSSRPHNKLIICLLHLGSL